MLKNFDKFIYKYNKNIKLKNNYYKIYIQI